MKMKMRMKTRSYSAKERLRRYFRDASNRKAFIIGLIVFIVVFVGLNLYGKAVEKRQGDMIVSGGILSGEGNLDEDGTMDNGVGSYGAEGAFNGGDAQGATGLAIDGSDAYDESQGQGQGTIFVDIGGAVIVRGLYALPAGCRIAEGIEAAGGLVEDAEVKYINQATILCDGDRLYIPTIAEVKDGTAPPTVGQVTANGGYSGGSGSGATGSGTGNGTGGGTGAGDSEQLLVNLNTANSEELQKLSGVGPVTAQKIIDYRTKRGGFKRVEELMNVSGIGTKTFEKLKDYITV